MHIAVSQRVEWLEDRGERRDCLDQAWITVLEELGYLPIPLPNTLSNPVEWTEATQIDGMLLTGGNDVTHVCNASNPAPRRDRTEQKLLELAEEQSMPVFAHCRGLQMMNVYLGGNLSPITGHVATRHPIDWLGDEGRDILEVNSYHNWAVAEDDLGEEATILALDEDGYVEAFRHERFPWVAVMWHPEREPKLNPLDRKLVTGCFSEQK